MTRKALIRIMLLSVMMVFFVSICLSVHDEPMTTFSAFGSRGTEVRNIQTKLKNMGLYYGAIDGIYGHETERAVIRFQRQKGLRIDGIAGYQTLRALGLAGTSNSSSNRSNDQQLLARVISAEARGEPYTGQVAVGAVVLNRVKHPSFPNSISGVVYQPGAFTCITDGQFSRPVSDSARRAAQDALNGWDPSGGAIYYYNPAKTTNNWIYSRPVTKVIGSHYFAK